MKLRAIRIWAVSVAAAIVASSTGTAAAQTTPGATDYSRTDRTFSPGISLRTRGYYPDHACLRSWSPCVTATIKTFRPEATAQARVIQELGARSAGTV